ncbi:MAG TPA: hypothetical protein VK846_09610, partial [Candidatus Limnocylindria bacterium]|nr:hypothetical protein [Candidatus Limnocylindria bacterium]
VSGTDLDGLTHLRFTHSGITAISTPTNRFDVTIAKAVPPGMYQVRAVGKHGASNPRAFAVGVLPEVMEGKNSSDSPQTVALESTINGRTDANTVDYFLFSAKKGQRVLARCETRAIDSRLEPALALYDSTGREVSRARSGGLLEHSVPEDGEFTLRLHDTTYRGGADFFYRLSIGTFPHVDYVVPIAGDVGEKAKFAIYGRNLPGGKVMDAKAKPALERIEVKLAENDAGLTVPLTTIPAQAGLDLFEYRIRNEGGVSDAALIRFPMVSAVAEEEPNNAPAAARKITPPCEVAGQLFPNDDRDWFRFDAQKGEVYWIEVISHRLGLPTDPFVLVQRVGTNGATDVLELNDSEANVGGAEFNTTHRDPSGRFEVKEDGTYRVQVRDLFSQPQRNPALVYHLVIRKPSPDFRLVAWPATPLPVKKDAKDIAVAATSLRRDEVLPIKVLAFRRDGFAEAIDVSARNLVHGLSAPPGRIEAGKNSTLIFLRATEDCAASIGTVKIQGTASVSGTNVTREAKAASLTWNVTDPATEAVQSHVGAEYVVSTIEEMCPVRLTATEEKTWEVVAGSKVKIPLTIKSDGELTGNLKLKTVGAAGLESAKEFDLDPKSTNAVYEIDLGQQKLAPGTYTFALQGLASVKATKAAKGEKKPATKEATFTLYSAPITLKVSPVSTNSPAK